MQISDMIGQYNRNISQDVSVAAPAPKAQELVNAIKGMTAGSIFEGTVNELHRGEVVLGLSNGQTLAARLTGNVALSVGQSMFFQVKSNSGSQVEIRPYMNGNLSNPILLKALDTAGIPANERTIAMVNHMMEEQMSIDKLSLMDMSRTAVSQPDIDIGLVVQMKKLDIPVTPEMANQFSNYKQDQSAITAQMDTFFSELPQAFTGEQMTVADALHMNEQILKIIYPEDMVQLQQAASAEQEAPAEQAVQSETQNGVVPQETQNKAAAPETLGKLLEQLSEGSSKSEIISGEQEAPQRAQQDYPEGSVGRLLTKQQAESFGRQLTELLGSTENKQLFTDGKPNLEQSPKEMLLALQQALQQGEVKNPDSVKKLLSDEPYQKLLRNVFEQEWLVKPEDLKTADKIKDLYQKLEHQMAQMERVFEQAGLDKSQLMRATTDVRGNVEFMNQINQAYTYIQIPLKLHGQNAHSDLYVYSNKKSLADKEGDLTAFLHLDLEHLGSTDVSITMKGKQVHTDFFLEDDKSFDLVMEHMDELEERLEKKGYQCTIQVQNREKKVDFVEDFLKKDQPSTGRLHRYSFDVRA